MSFIQKVEAQAEIKVALNKYILARVTLLAWMAGRLEDLADNLPQQYSAVSAVFNLEFFIAQIKKLDDAYATKEAALYNEYQPLIQKHNKPNSLETNEMLTMAIAEVKNKINIAVAAVNSSANKLLKTPQADEIEGAPKARLEYLSNLTLQKQIDEFEYIIERMKD